MANTERKVAVLGGGIGALSAAYELATAPLAMDEPPWDITVYQLGWRLGGRCASARDANQDYRSEEHGLHIWFGFYQNAFGLMDRVYKQLGRTGAHPFKDVQSAFVPRADTAFGSELETHGAWELTWPVQAGNPWDPTTPDVVSALLAMGAWLESIVSGQVATVGIPPFGTPITVALTPLTGVLTDALVAAARAAIQVVRTALAVPFLLASPGNPAVQRAWVLVDLAFSVLDGLLDPAAGVLRHGDLGRIDHWEFRDWMRHHGAFEPHLWEAPVRAMYDTAFAYRGGDPRKPSWAAGVAVRVVLRIALTYRGSVFYVPTAGFGETVIQPLYEALLAKGVKFEFFQRVDALEASSDHREISRIRLTRQARVLAGSYDPTIVVNSDAGTFDAWPTEPLWSQLANGAAMQASRVNFESWWTKRSGTRLELQLGRDFDHVILGIPLHAARDVLGDFADHCVLGRSLKDVEPIPSVSVQLWFDEPSAELSNTASAGLVAGPRTFDISTDMSHVLATEPWTSAPSSVQYLCAVAPFVGATTSPAATGVQAQANSEARTMVRRFLNDAAWAIWPNLVAQGAAFPWVKLHDAQNRWGSLRLRAQHIRANVDPRECCPSSFAGTIAHRPTADGTGVRNLYLANDSVRTGLDTSCVETAVMAGRQAARSLLGASYAVPGEAFLSVLPTRASAEAKAIECASQVALVAANGRSVLLPPYVDQLGLGEVSVGGPFAFDGCTSWLFPIDGDITKLQALVDRQLNVPTQNAFQFTVVVSRLVLLWLHAERAYSNGQNVGATEDNEMAVALVIRYEVPGEGPKLAFWMPYMIIDSPMGMIAGREIWGFPKELGSIDSPQPTTGLTCGVEAMSFEPFSQQGAGAERTVVSITDPTPWLPPIVSSVSGVVLPLLQLLSGGLGSLVATALEPLLSAPPGELPIVNLKVFRDAEDDTRACVSQLVESGFSLTLSEFGLYPRSVNYTFASPLASHNLVGQLLPSTPGIETGSVAASVRLKFSFKVGAGRIVWSSAP